MTEIGSVTGNGHETWKGVDQEQILRSKGEPEAAVGDSGEVGPASIATTDIHKEILGGLKNLHICKQGAVYGGSGFLPNHMLMEIVL